MIFAVLVAFSVGFTFFVHAAEFPKGFGINPSAEIPVIDLCELDQPETVAPRPFSAFYRPTEPTFPQTSLVNNGGQPFVNNGGQTPFPLTSLLNDAGVLEQNVAPMEFDDIFLAFQVVTPLFELTKSDFEYFLPEYNDTGSMRGKPLRQCLEAVFNAATNNYTVKMTELRPLKNARHRSITCSQPSEKHIIVLRNTVMKANQYLALRDMPTIDTNDKLHHLVLNAALLVYYFERVLNLTFINNEVMLWSEDDQFEGADAPRHKMYIALRLAKLITQADYDDKEADMIIGHVVAKLDSLLQVLLPSI